MMGEDETTYRLLWVLARYTNWKTGMSFVSIPTLVEILGVSRSTVDRRIRILKSIGLLTSQLRDRRNHESNLWHLPCAIKPHHDDA
jgi:DNA-binding transcriptional MocR family regulator